MGIVNDHDPVETQEWVDSLRAVVQHQGVERARFLLTQLRDEAVARRRAADVHRSRRPTHNTIPPEQEEKSPGNRELEHKIRSAIRWNAVAIILRANKESSELGGHIASFQCSALLYDIGFGHFWHAPTEEHGGDLIYVQGHVSPGIYARAFVEGRLTEQQLLNYPAGKRRQRHPVVSASVADARLLAVSHGVDGPRAADGDLPGALPQVSRGPRPREDRRPQGVGVPGRRRMRRAGIAGRDLDGGPREARQPDLRHQLQPAAAGRSGARQRQDHPGAGGRLPRRGLERDQGGVGLGLGQALRQGQGRHPAQAHGRMRRRPVPGLQEQGRRVRARAFLQHAGIEGAGRRPVRRARCGSSIAAATIRSRCTRPMRRR